MANSINTNNASISAQRQLNSTQKSQMTAMQRLSSGLRINSAKDDAAGLAIAERMSTQISGNKVAIRNANDAISYSQTAEGTLSTMADNLKRMRDLAVQSRNVTNSSGDRSNLAAEFKQLQQEVARQIDGAKFNDQAIFASGASTSLAFQVGAGTSDADKITVAGFVMGGGAATTASSISANSDLAQLMATVTTAASTASANGLTIGGTQGDVAAIDNAIDALDVALDKVNQKRADFGAVQNRFDAVIKNLEVTVENDSAAEGRIRDADYATEAANLSKSQILQQAGTAMLAQANQLPQSVLQLLG